MDKEFILIFCRNKVWNLALLVLDLLSLQIFTIELFGAKTHCLHFKIQDTDQKEPRCGVLDETVFYKVASISWVLNSILILKYHSGPQRWV